MTLIGRPDNVADIKKMFCHGVAKRQYVVIAGGGETGYHLARALDSERHRVLLLESNPDRCAYLASHLTRATILCADATRKITLEEERVGGCDFFVACTGNDENNIMAGLEAKELGANRIMAIVGRPDYAGIVGRLGIDKAVSERDAMARQILGLLTEGPILSQLKLPGTDILVLEIEVTADAPISKLPLAEIKLPDGVLIAAVLQGEFVSVPGALDCLQAGNTALVLAPEKQLQEVRSAFAVD